MSYRALSEALLNGKPYAGAALQALQGPPERQRYFRPVVKAAAEAVPAPIRILEIGSWAGVSAISWGTALKDLNLEGDITCVDPWLPYFDINLNNADVYREMNRAAERSLIYKLFQHNTTAAGLQDILHVKQGSSREVLPHLPERAFTIVYIDGSHAYEDVVFDIEQAKRLLRDCGILCGDDLELQNGEIEPKELADAVQGGHDFVLSGSATRHYHPGVTAAVGEVIGKVSVWEGFWAVRIQGAHLKQVALDLNSAGLPPHILPFFQRMEGQTAGYSLYFQAGRYYAVSDSVPSEVVGELLTGYEFPPIVLVGRTFQEVKEKAEACTGQISVERPHEPQIVGQHRNFNIVRLKDLVYGVRQSIGEVNLSLDSSLLANQYDQQDVIIGTTVDGIKTRIDCVELLRNVECLEQKIQLMSDHFESTKNQLPAWLDEFRSSTSKLQAQFASELAKIAQELAQEREQRQLVLRAAEQRAAESLRQAVEAAKAAERLQRRIDDRLTEVTALVKELRRKTS